MSRSTRNRRGAPMEAMQDDPEAILRGHQGGARSARAAATRERREVQASNTSQDEPIAGTMQPQDAAPEDVATATAPAGESGAAEREQQGGETFSHVSEKDESGEGGEETNGQTPTAPIRSSTNAGTESQPGGYDTAEGEQTGDEPPETDEGNGSGSESSRYSFYGWDQPGVFDDGIPSGDDDGHGSDGGEGNGQNGPAGENNGDGSEGEEGAGQNGSSGGNNEDRPEGGGIGSAGNNPGAGPQGKCGNTAGDNNGIAGEYSGDRQREGDQVRLTACERVAATLNQPRKLPAIDPEVTIENGRHLTLDTVHVAIASVTEAISELQNAAEQFALVDRVSGAQRAIRPGRTLIWPFHRARTDAARGGHISLFTIEDLKGTLIAQHRDSYLPMRDHHTVQTEWETIRPTLTAGSTFAWDINNSIGDDGPSLVAIPGGQYNQAQSWTCGLCTIINAWMRALRLSHSDTAPNMGGNFTHNARRIVDMAIRGQIGSNDIRDFLECYGFVDSGDAIPNPGRVFQNTVGFESPDTLTQRVALLRLRKELEMYGDGHPSVEQMLEDARLIDENADFSHFATIQDLYQAHRDAINFFADGDYPGTGVQTNATAPAGGQAEQDQGDPGQIAETGATAENARDPGAQTDGSTHVERHQEDPETQPQLGVLNPDGSATSQQEPGQTDGSNQAANTGVSDNAPDQGSNALQEQDVSGTENHGNNATDQPPANMQAPNYTAAGNGAAAQRQDEQQARPSARERLRPANDIFRPGSPLRAPPPAIQRGIDAGESGLSLQAAQYFDSPRHNALRERFGLDDRTHVFDVPRPQAFINGPPAAAPTGNADREEPSQQDPPAETEESQQPAAGEGTANPDPATENSPALEESREPAAGQETANAELEPEEPPAPPATAAGTNEPRIPGLDSKRPNPHAPSTNDEKQHQTRRPSAESHSTLHSYEYYERQEAEEAEQRAAEQAEMRLQARRAGFHGASARGRRQAREEREAEFDAEDARGTRQARQDEEEDEDEVEDEVNPGDEESNYDGLF